MRQLTDALGVALGLRQHAAWADSQLLGLDHADGLAIIEEGVVSWPVRGRVLLDSSRLQRLLCTH